jgi:predicted Fe-Mo cluster-binding NifX family protein
MTRIAVPSDDRQTINPHFGRTAGFLVFNHEGDALTSEYRGVQESSPEEVCCGGGGASHHELIVRTIRDCDVVIAGGMGGPMMSALYDAGIEVALSSVANARSAVEMFVNDILPASTGSGCCTS